MRDRIHPGAWWLWALALATAATRTTNPWLLLLIVAVAGCVVAQWRSTEPQGGAFRLFLIVGLSVIAIRVLFHALISGIDGTTVLFTLPAADLPDWAAGIELGGDVTAEGVASAAYAGLSLATLLCCIGAANAIADTARLLRGAPGAVYEASVACVVALTVAPQLLTSAHAAWQARSLRGATGTRRRALGRVAIAVLTDALDRAIALAAAMDSRGYGRMPQRPRLETLTRRMLLLAGVVGVMLGAYALLGVGISTEIGVAVLTAGTVLAVAGLVLGSRRVARTQYRPIRWGRRELFIVASGIAAPTAVIGCELLSIGALTPPTSPLAVPGVPAVALVGILIAAAPSLLRRHP